MGLYVGLMSGTSLDGVDGVVLQVDPAARPFLQVRAHAHRALPVSLADELLALNRSGSDELHRAACATHGLMELHAQVVSDLLASCGLAPGAIAAVGVHGQTVRHRPAAFGDTGYTLQLVNGALLAERTGITTVCDFRSADVAAGGQGAPLVPAFHAAWLSERERDVALLNLGGIANLTLLPRQGGIGGFDTGPGNLLMNLWCQKHRQEAYDRGGAWAAQGTVLEPLLGRMLADAYFARPAPKSTGRDDFHADWLDRCLRESGCQGAAPVDVMASLAELTALTVAASLRSALPGAERLVACGGGARNGHVLRRLAAALPGVEVLVSDAAGIAPDQVEAAAFAWLAHQRLHGHAANLPAVTGARGLRVLGAVYAAPGPVA